MPELLLLVMSAYQTYTTKEAFFFLIGLTYPPGSAEYQKISLAYRCAEETFADKNRKSGEQYFEHLRAVALILIVHARIVDADVIAAALLHDIIEDYPKKWTYERVEAMFGTRIAVLVWYVTKPDPADYDDNKVRAMSMYHLRLYNVPLEYQDAVRIKLADRLHNMLTIWSMSNGKIHEKLYETEHFYLTLAESISFFIHETESVISYVKLKLINEKIAQFEIPV